MANTIPDGIYYPENTTDMELDTILATMASSIQNGIGKRVATLEENSSMMANLPTTQNFVTQIPQTVNYQITSVGYNDGMTFSGGVVTIVKPGLYFISFNGFVLSSLSTSNGSGLFSIVKSGSVIGAGLAILTPSGSTSGGSTSGSVTALCVAGDTISIRATITAATGALSVNAANPTFNTFSVALLKASNT